MPATVLLDSEDEEEDLLGGSEVPLKRKPSDTCRKDKTVTGVATMSMTKLEKPRPTTVQRIGHSLKRSQSDMLGSSQDRTAVGRLKRIKSSQQMQKQAAQDLDEIVIGCRVKETTRDLAAAGSILQHEQPATAMTGDTVPYTEQTQQMMEQMVSKKTSRATSNANAAIATQSSFPWTAHDSPESMRTGKPQVESQDTSEVAHHEISELVDPDEAGELIEQYLADKDLHLSSNPERARDHHVPDAIGPDPVLPAFMNMSQGSLDELSLPALHATRPPRRVLRLKKHNSLGSAAVDEESQRPAEASTAAVTIDPAMLKADSPSTKESVLLGDVRFAAGGLPASTPPIQIDRIISLLGGSPVAEIANASQIHVDQASPVPEVLSPKKSSRSNKQDKKKSKCGKTNIFEDHIKPRATHGQPGEAPIVSSEALSVVPDGANKSVVKSKQSKSKAVVVREIVTSDHARAVGDMAKGGSFSNDRVDKLRTDVAAEQSDVKEVAKSSLIEKSPPPTSKASSTKPEDHEQHTSAIRDTEATTKNSPAAVPKTTLATPYRVGLSKRQRIPSLLRVVRPVKPA